MKEMLMRNKKLYRDYSRKFRETFKAPLDKYWDIMFGFDIIAFDKDLNCPDGTSLKDHIANLYGENASDLVSDLLGGKQMETYVIDKQFIKVHSIVHHFDCITWTLRARGESYREGTGRVHINQGIYYCTDANRMHVYSPDYEELPTSYEIPDGEYELVSANKKQIVLRTFPGGVFTWGNLLGYKRIGGVPKFTLNSESMLSISLFNWHISKHTKQCFNMDYIKDAAFTGDITFERTEKKNKWMSPIVFGTPERFAMIAPLKLPEED